MPKARKSKDIAPIQKFEARLERLRSSLQWIVAYTGFDAATVWGLRGQIRVKGEINGFPFRTSLFPTREGRHFLLVNKKLQRGARASEGEMARFEISLDHEERTVAPPAALARILKQDRSLQRWYDKLNYSTRSEIAKWITEPKTEEARTRRTEQMAERLLAVMDAEIELPPRSQAGIRAKSASLARMGSNVALAPARTFVWHLLLPHP
jgi:hypothetical protein